MAGLIGGNNAQRNRLFIVRDVTNRLAPLERCESASLQRLPQAPARVDQSSRTVLRGNDTADRQDHPTRGERGTASAAHDMSWKWILGNTYVQRSIAPLPANEEVPPGTAVVACRLCQIAMTVAAG